eukprot:2359241-Pyramimonas_sp.AAC.1
MEKSTVLIGPPVGARANAETRELSNGLAHHPRVAGEGLLQSNEDAAKVRRRDEQRPRLPGPIATAPRVEVVGWEERGGMRKEGEGEGQRKVGEGKGRTSVKRGRRGC